MNIFKKPPNCYLCEWQEDNMCLAQGFKDVLDCYGTKFCVKLYIPRKKNEDS